VADNVYLAVDLGASSGRVLAGRFDGDRIALEEVHRFENGPVQVGESLYWDALALWSQIQRGLRAAADEYGDAVESVGVDTWGVDFALLGRGDELLGNPYNYRDARTRGAMQRAFKTVSREEIFEATGLQFMELNTLYQVLAMHWADSPLLAAAEDFLMMPDFFHWLLTGEKANERTNATTTQFYDPQARNWATSLLERFGLPTKMLGRLAEPGTRLGKLRPAVAEATGLRSAQVVLPGTHDTASAVMAVPTVGQASNQPDWCYISSGTWSLMGVEVADPVITDKCLELNFTNEGGVGGTTRLLKNIAGLWILQECRRAWREEGKQFSWDDLVRMAGQAPKLGSLIDPDDPRFVAPKNMPAAIVEHCQKVGETPPDSEGEFVRCALESLAMRYRLVVNWLEELIGGRLEVIHIVGGGSQNELLCQMAADATGRRVLAGPAEATAIGNLAMQAVAAGEVSGIAQARELIGRSIKPAEYAPRDTAPWDEAFARFERILAK